jgi:GTP1/Obg family GTP-binding protein
MRVFFFLGCLILTACAPTSLDEYRREGEALCRRFTEDLQKIETREDLVKELPKIKRFYEEIADLMIEVKNFKEAHLGEATDTWSTPDDLASETLMIELKRVYRLEGAKELLEGVQRETYFRLDAALNKTIEK